MKKLTILLFALSTLTVLRAQNHQYIMDSAAFVVDRYLSVLNFEGVRSDSMLYIETYIYNRSNPHDTLVMKRWHVEPQYNRVEIWHHDELQQGYYTNCYDKYREYDAEVGRWTSITTSDYYDIFTAYDFRGPLYHWRSNGVELTYSGIWNYNGHEAYRVMAKAPHRFDRYYLFEKENGLLFLIDETDTPGHDMATKKDSKHTDWRAIHEFQPLGNVLFPSIESYQYEKEITLMFHHYKYLPINMDLFEKSKP